MTEDLKTPEQMAEEWAHVPRADQDMDECDLTWDNVFNWEVESFLAGYQAAKPYWTSIHDALPDTDEDVLWCNPHSGIVIVAPYNHKFDGELGEQYFTHWMLVPELPKVDK